MKIDKLSALAVLLFLVILTGLPAIAQETERTCAINLKEAQSLYQSGKIESIPALITDCIKSGFTKEEGIQAYKLLINAYIFDNNIQKSEEMMLAFLQKYPEYEIIATDPNEFVHLMDQFNNRPRLLIGIMTGINLSQIRTSENIGTHQVKGNPGDYKPDGVGFQVGFMLAKNLTERIEFDAEAQYKQAVYSYVVKPEDISLLKFRETQSSIQFPVTSTYTFLHGKLRPYIRAGFLSGLIVSSSANLTKTFADNVATPVSGEQINLIDKRNRINFWAIIGGGIKYKIPKGYLRADIRYNFGLKNQVNNNSWTDTRSDLEWKYGYRDDKNIRDDLAFNIGYVRIIYNPRKK